MRKRCTNRRPVSVRLSVTVVFPLDADTDCASKVGYLTKYQNFSNSKWRTLELCDTEAARPEEPRMIGLAYLTEETFDDILAVWTQQLYTPL